MFVEVVPLMKLPRQFGSFDYEIPEDLRDTMTIGSLVIIPWRGRRATGIVFGIREQPSDGAHTKKIKQIDGVLNSPPLPLHIIKTIIWIRDTYFHSLGTIAHALVPTPPQRWIKKNNQATTVLRRHTLFSSQKKKDVSTLTYESTEEKIALLLNLIAHNHHRGTLLIITPHHEDILTISAGIGKKYQSHTALYHGALSPTVLWQTWCDILNESKKIVIGTRMAILAPVQQIGAIIFLESESIDHRQYDQNPRFDARNAGSFIGDFTHAQIYFLSHAHRPEEYSISIPEEIKKRGQTSEVTLCTIPKTGRASLEKILAPKAIDAIEYALEEKKKIFIFHNHRGSAHVLYCIDCKTLFRCERCTLPLTVHDSTLRCHHCATSSPVPSACIKCHGPHLTPLGAGNIRLSTLLATQFPDARIATWDSDVKKSHTILSYGQADIIIGTQLFLHDLCETIIPTIPLGVIIATCMDDFLHHANFRATEQAWRITQQLIHLSTTTHAALYLQTFDNENALIRQLLEPQTKFLPTELASRKQLHYPPSTILLTITSVDANSHTLDARMTQLRHSLSILLSTASSPGKVFGPLVPTPPFRHGKWRSAVAIKTVSISTELANFLRKLPDAFLIDRD